MAATNVSHKSLYFNSHSVSAPIKKGKQHVCLMANKKIIFEVSLLPCLIWSSAVLESSYLLLESLTSIQISGWDCSSSITVVLFFNYNMILVQIMEMYAVSNFWRMFWQKVA